MPKKKAIICTIFFAIIFYAGYGILIFTSPEIIYRSLPSLLAGFWMGERIKDFYKWLIKD